jgi:hypothetical protein
MISDSIVCVFLAACIKVIFNSKRPSAAQGKAHLYSIWSEPVYVIVYGAQGSIPPDWESILGLFWMLVLASVIVNHDSESWRVWKSFS